jgi:hypothetical protein
MTPRRVVALIAVIVATVAGIVYADGDAVALVLLVWGSFALPVCWAWRRLFDELLEQDDGCM